MTPSDKYQNKQTQEAGPNPLAGIDITVSVPETVDIKLVDARTLTDYEIWITIFTILASITTGFWVSFSGNTIPEKESLLIVISFVFTGLTIISFIIACIKRRTLRKKSKTYNLPQR